MTTWLIVGGVVLALLIGLLVGAVVRGQLFLPADRRRLANITARLQAEARLDALTRSTMQAMRDTVHHRPSRQ